MLARLATQRLREIRQVFRISPRVFSRFLHFFWFSAYRNTAFDLISFFACAGISIFLHRFELREFRSISQLILWKCFSSLFFIFIFLCSILILLITIQTFHGSSLMRTKKRWVKTFRIFNSQAVYLTKL